MYGRFIFWFKQGILMHENTRFFSPVAQSLYVEIYKTTFTSFPISSSLFSTIPQGAMPMATTLFFSLVVLSLIASPTCLVTPVKKKKQHSQKIQQITITSTLLQFSAFYETFCWNTDWFLYIKYSFLSLFRNINLNVCTVLISWAISVANAPLIFTSFYRIWW